MRISTWQTSQIILKSLTEMTATVVGKNEQEKAWIEKWNAHCPRG